MFEVISPFKDVARFEAVLSRMPEPDAHIGANYLKAQLQLGVQPFLAVYTSRDGTMVAQPFVLRLTEVCGEVVLDMESPVMGYGGSHARWGSSFDIVRTYDDMRIGLEAWAREQGVVSEHCIMNPMHIPLQRWLRAPSERVVQRKSVVAMYLGQQPGNHRADIRMDRAKGIVRAVSNGAEAFVCERVPYLSVFMGMYSDMLDRKGASKSWSVPRAYVEELLNRNGSLFAVAGPDAQVQAMALVVYDERVAYYHMACRVEKPTFPASDVLIDYVAAYVREHYGCKWLHLGGGVTSSNDDPLLKYKREFSDIALPVFCYGHTINEERYVHLCDRKIRHEMDATGTTNIESTFYPPYRRPDPPRKENAA